MGAVPDEVGEKVALKAAVQGGLAKTIALYGYSALLKCVPSLDEVA